MNFIFLKLDIPSLCKHCSLRKKTFTFKIIFLIFLSSNRFRSVGYQEGQRILTHSRRLKEKLTKATISKSFLT